MRGEGGFYLGGGGLYFGGNFKAPTRLYEPLFVSMTPCLFSLDVHHHGHGSHYSVQHAAGHYCRDSTISTGQLRVSQRHGSVDEHTH